MGEDDFKTANIGQEEVEKVELAKDPELANLGGAASKSADFSNSYFKGDAKFNLVKFSKIANFSGVNFSKAAEFATTQFQQKADFSKANFRGETSFIGGTNFKRYANFFLSNFFDKTYFEDYEDIGVFNGKTRFNYVYFEGKEKIVFDTQDLSKVSFRNTDLTRVAFGDKVTWGKGEKKEHKFKIIEERSLEKYLKYSISWRKITRNGSKDNAMFIHLLKDVGVKWEGQLELERGKNHHSCESISLKVSRGSLFIDNEIEHENLEVEKNLHFGSRKIVPVHSLSLELDEDKTKAYLEINGSHSVLRFVTKHNNQDFTLSPSVFPYGIEEQITVGNITAIYRNIREEATSKNNKEAAIRGNDWVRRNLSLTGLYYRFSNYGESILKPILIGIIIVGLSTLF